MPGSNDSSEFKSANPYEAETIDPAYTGGGDKFLTDEQLRAWCLGQTDADRHPTTDDRLQEAQSLYNWVKSGVTE